MKEANKIRHEKFIADHRRGILFIDILGFIIIFMNFSAMFMTNMMVMEKDSHKAGTTVIMEVNPVVAAESNLVLHPKWLSKMRAIGIWMLKWAAIVGLYVYNRMTMFRKMHLARLTAIVLLAFIFLGGDFFNNLGLFLGIIIYGG